MSDSDIFSWEDKASVVVDRVDAIAVYANPYADVVIRQEDRMGGEDAIIVIPRDRIPDLIEALSQAKTEADNM